MRIKRLQIDDFGIIRNQTLDNISPGMVVIGGPNRAGKTTFLNLLRCLGYGFKGQSNIPPSTSQYRVEGDFVIDNEDIYHLLIEGFSQPKVTCIKGNKSKVDSSYCLYNNLDPFTYQQLFTISLEELRRLPENIGKNEEDKLQSVLLGAGLKDILQVTPVEMELRKEAEKIGGKKGSPKVKKFGDFYPEIIEGLELRDEAKEQVSIYYEKQKEREQTNSRIEQISTELQNLAQSIIKLDFLKNWHQGYQRINELQHTLKTPAVAKILQYKPRLSNERINEFIEDYKKILKDYEEQYENFRNKLNLVTSEDIDRAKEALTNSLDQLDASLRQASGLKEKIHVYEEEKEKTQNTEESLVAEADKLKEGFGEDIEQIRQIPTDHLNYDNLSKYVDDYYKTSQEKKEAREEKEKLRQELSHLNHQLENIKAVDIDKLFKKYFGLALGFVAAGVFLGVINWIGGILLGIVGITGVGVFMLIKYQHNSQQNARREDLNKQIDRIEKLIEFEQNKESQAGNKLVSIWQELDKYRTQLNLNPEITPQMLKDHFQKVSILKDKVEDLRATQEKIQEKKIQLEKELKELYYLIEKIYEGVYLTSFKKKVSSDEILPKNEFLFMELERFASFANEAKELSKHEYNKYYMENKIISELENEASLESTIGNDDAENILSRLQKQKEYIQEYEKYKKMEYELNELTSNLLSSLKMDRIRDAFELKSIEQDEQEELLKTFYYHWNKFASSEEVEETYQEKKQIEKELKDELEELKNKSQELKLELSELATDKNLLKSQAKIDKGRKKLKPIAEKYAVQNGAALILNEAKSMFLKEAKDKLLIEANKYLQEITGGDYREIMPPRDLVNADFQVENKDGDLIDTTEILSRGTKEQLFLAVRLSRIKEITPPLPVILDDTLANFDMHHLDRTASLLADLTNTHQLFVLTCHPELIKAINYYTSNPQFIKLNEGKFSAVDGEELLEFLSSEF